MLQRWDPFGDLRQTGSWLGGGDVAFGAKP